LFQDFQLSQCFLANLITVHLEHHLYPQVPSHHLAELARRLDPFFEQAGVQVWHVI
jgi:beta-carotene hydroxylase